MKRKSTPTAGLALVSSLFFFSCAGCQSCDLVEAELRTKERQLRELQDELCSTRLFNEALHNELRVIRPQSGSSLSPEQASQIYTLKEIALGRTTGGRDDDGKPGDEALHVLIEPRDPDGHPIKAPGSVRVEAAQISTEGLKAPLCYWDIPPAQLRQTWRSGLFANGYDLVLPWKVQPISEKVRVTVRLSVADGRVFEADKDVTIRVAHGVMPHPAPAFVPDKDLIMPHSDPIAPLPTPRPAATEAGPELQPAGVTSGKWTPAGWQRLVQSSANKVELQRPEPLK